MRGGTPVKCADALTSDLVDWLASSSSVARNARSLGLLGRKESCMISRHQGGKLRESHGDAGWKLRPISPSSDWRGVGRR